MYKATITLLVISPDFGISSSLKNNRKTENRLCHKNSIQWTFISTSIMIDQLWRRRWILRKLILTFNSVFSSGSISIMTHTLCYEKHLGFTHKMSCVILCYVLLSSSPSSCILSQFQYLKDLGVSLKLVPHNATTVVYKI